MENCWRRRESKPRPLGQALHQFSQWPLGPTTSGPDRLERSMLTSARIPTAAIADSDRHAIPPVVGPQSAVSGSGSKARHSRNPAKPRDFPAGRDPVASTICSSHLNGGGGSSPPTGLGSFFPAIQIEPHSQQVGGVAGVLVSGRDSLIPRETTGKSAAYGRSLNSLRPEFVANPATCPRLPYGQEQGTLCPDQGNRR